MDLETPVRNCDLAAIARLAGTRPEHNRADRFALLQVLLNEFGVNGSDRDRLEDMANIAAQHPLLCDTDLAGLTAEVKSKLQSRYGPMYEQLLSVESTVMGLIKEPSGQEAVRILLNPVDQAGTHDNARTMVPLNYVVALCRKLIDLNFPSDGDIEVAASSRGQSSMWGNLRSCPDCGGRCQACAGTGLVSNLRFGDRLCSECNGKGVPGEKCHCVIYLEVPPGACPGWIARMKDRAGKTLWPVRIGKIR